MVHADSYKPVFGDLIDVVEAVAGDLEEDADLASVRSLVEGTAESSQSVTEFPPLMFLNGGAMSYSMSSSEFVPLLPAPAAMPRSPTKPPGSDRIAYGRI